MNGEIHRINRESLFYCRRDNLFVFHFRIEMFVIAEFDNQIRHFLLSKIAALPSQFTRY